MAASSTCIDQACSDQSTAGAHIKCMRKGPRAPWTPDDRQKWVEHARNSEAGYGVRDGYAYHVMPPAGVVDPDDKCARATDALAQLVYQSDPRYRALGMGFYHMLTDKLRTHQVIGPLYGRRVVALVKGSNAHAILLPHLALPSSDLDIVIYVDPRCDAQTHANLRQILHVLVVQTMSQHKRAIDHTFFLDRAGREAQQCTVLEPDVAAQFKQDHIQAMERAGLVSVFSDQRVRNLASRNSMVIVESKAREGAVAKIEVPHFDKCERIPLCRTPVFCSYNETIGTFNLYRIKFNSMAAPDNDTNTNKDKDKDKDEDKNSDGGVQDKELSRQDYEHEHEHEHDEGDMLEEEAATENNQSRCRGRPGRLHRVQADFIDVTIPGQDDKDLHRFWKQGRFVATLEPHSDLFVLTPDLQWCVQDLWDLLHVHECPESKRLKRENKHALLLQELSKCSLGMPPTAQQDDCMTA